MAIDPQDQSILPRRTFQPCPDHKDSDVEWLGSIPAEWQCRRLKYCAPLINERAENLSTNLPYLGLENIESWTGKKVESEAMPEAEGQANRFRAGDVLFGKLRPYLAKVFRATGEGICTGELLVLRPRGMVQDYLFYYILARDFISIVDSSTYGAKMPRASWNLIGNLPALIPSIPEQRAIAGFLDRETSRIDDLIVKKQRQIELLEEKRTALIRQAVTKGLDPNVPMKDSGMEWIGRIPAYWEIWKLGHLATGGNGSTPDRSRLEYWSDGSIPWLNSSIVNHAEATCADQFVTEAAVRDCHLPYVPAGSVLIALTGQGKTRGAAVVLSFRSTINQHLAYVTPAKGRVETWYLRWLFFTAYDYLRAMSDDAGGTKGALTCGFISSLMIPVPPMREQQAIAVFVSSATTTTDLLIAKLESSIVTLREYRVALVSATVTGKINIQEGGA
jgi:type I restriction enzyme S subunit